MNKKEITKEDCIKWKKDKFRNPHTNYEFKAKEKSAEYKRFKKTCEGIKTPETSFKEEINEVIIKNQKTAITKDLCYKWIANKGLINPITNSIIDKNGKLYKEIEKACIKLKIIDEKTKEINKEHQKFIDNYDKQNQKKEKVITKNPKYKLKYEPTLDDCKKWIKNKLINPRTNVKINENGEIYLQLKNKCEALGIVDSKINEKKEIIKPRIIRRKIRQNIENISPEIKIEQKLIRKRKEKELTDTYYPDLDDIDFNKKLLELKEINVHKIDEYPNILTIEDFEKKATELCSGFDKSSFQYLMAHYLSYRTPYKSLMLYYGVGVGKTCSAITIAESLLVNHSSFEEAKIWVILPGAIEGGFKNQIFDLMKFVNFSDLSNQCTGDTYLKLAQLSKETDQKVAEKRIKKIIKSRYNFFTYEGFANFIDNQKDKSKIFKDKVIIVDEAHNIRSGGDDDENKRVYNALLDVCSNGINNRLILLTATPMYNEPSDIYNLFYLLLVNDKRIHLYNNEKIFDSNSKITKEAKDFISQMSSNYISYLRGKNPFNFAIQLSPKLSGIEILEKEFKLKENGEPIDELDKNWLSKLDYDITISQLGEKQLNFFEKKQKLEDDKYNILNNHQPMNIVYENNSGKEGFNNFFIKEGTQEQVIVRYQTKYKNALSPDNINKYSGKIKKIYDIIKKSKGIVIIYSGFIWAGIIPIAIMLEHMGFTREGTFNILSQQSITNPVNYDGIKNPKYAILSSDNPEIMGNTSIDNLMSKINNPENKNGELVKVVLITRVASEGLNFQNVRELHILDPWYHFNKIDQIIGRGIRNCSHKNLPISERNVTVYLHCGINGYERETTDIHTYRIATRKLYQSFLVDEIIKNNAIDCALFKSINYFPQSMFKLGKIELITSQGIKINYQFGDENKYKTNCKVNLNELKENKVGFREETYKHLALNIQIKLKKIILNFIHNNKRFITYEYLKEIFNYVDYKILMHTFKISIYPNVIIDNIILLPHENGIHIIDIIEDKPLKINISKEIIEENRKKYEINIDFYNKLKIEDNYYNASIGLYESLDEITFKLLINKLFQSEQLNKEDKFIEDVFIKEGILIKPNEIPSIVTTDKYVGFINIFTEEFEPLIYNTDGINHKLMNKKQKEQLISNRNYLKIPDDFTKETYAWGLIVPIYETKEKHNKINIFKLLTPGVIYGKKTGIVCTSLQKKEHNKILTDLGLEDIKNTKQSYCNKIAIELAKINRLTLLPQYKPK